MSEEEETDSHEAPVAVAPRERLNWKQKAQRLYEGREVAREQTRKMMMEKQVDQFRESLNQLLGAEYEPEELSMVIDDVKFVAVPGVGPGSSLEIHVEFRCRACGGVQHQHVRGLADIAAILNGHSEPHDGCPKNPRAVVELNAAEKLIEALREFMASELEQVE